MSKTHRLSKAKMSQYYESNLMAACDASSSS